LLFVRDVQNTKELQALNGLIAPSTEEVDLRSYGCPYASTADLVMIFGSVAHVSHVFPHAVIRIECDTLLAFDKLPSGCISVSMSLFDRDGKVVVSLDKDRFTINPNNYFSKSRGDRNTLSVYDQFDQEILYVHMANPTVLFLRARISDPRISHPIVPELAISS